MSSTISALRSSSFTRLRIVGAPQIQLLQRVRRVQIARPHVQRRDVSRRRLRVVAQLQLREARDLVVQRVLALGIGDRRHQAPVTRGQIVQLAQRARQPLDAGLHVRILRLLGQRPRQRLVGARRVVQADLVALRDLLVERDLLLRIDGVARLDLVDARSAAASRRGPCRSAPAAARRPARAPGSGRCARAPRWSRCVPARSAGSWRSCRRRRPADRGTARAARPAAPADATVSAGSPATRLSCRCRLSASSRCSPRCMYSRSSARSA